MWLCYDCLPDLSPGELAALTAQAEPEVPENAAPEEYEPAWEEVLASAGYIEQHNARIDARGAEKKGPPDPVKKTSPERVGLEVG